MKQTDPQIKLRLPPQIKEKIDKAVAINRRTLSGEIIARLEWSFAVEEDFAKHQEKTDARSELAMQRILRANLTTRPDPIETRFTELETQIATIKEQLEALIADHSAGNKIKAIEGRLAKLEK